MSNYKSTLQSNNAELSSNNLNLQSLIERAGALPNAGGIELPELTNEGSAADLLAGKELIDSDGNKVTGTMPTGSAKTPATTITKTPSITVNSSGLITASVSGTQNITPTVTAGYVSSGTGGIIAVRGSATQQLTTQAAKTITPTKASQTAVSSGVYTTGDITVNAIPDEYIIPAGTLSITTSGSHDVTTYESVNVDIESGTDTSDATATADEIFAGETSYGANGKMTGTFTIDSELSTQGNLLKQLQNALKGKALPPSVPSTTASKNEVNFYDYDGTILYSYTVEEAQALTELPPLPTQPGLICQEWNYDLETIKSYNRAVDVGATYITDDGKTRLYIRIADEVRMTVPLYFNQSVSKGVIIDWGDGSATKTLSGSGNVNTKHTYTNIGDYIITLEVTNGTLRLGKGSSTYCVMGYTNYEGYTYCSMLQKVEIGNGVTELLSYAFQGCSSLASIAIPNSVTSIGSTAFDKCHSLASIVIPNGVKIIAYYAFQGCSSLASIVIPNSVTGISAYAFQSCYSIVSIVIPNSVTSIDHDAFWNCTHLVSIVIPNSVTRINHGTFCCCYGMAVIDFTSHTSVPTLDELQNQEAFTGVTGDIKVPAALYDEWIVATNWAAYLYSIVDENGRRAELGDEL